MGLVRSIAARFFPSRNRFSRSPDAPEHLRLGEEGEDFAVRHLKRNGYKVLYRNFRAPHGGEVDIVCREKDVLVFVEVKTRRSLLHGTPAEAVTLKKQHLITRGALTWLRMLDDPEIVGRFDVVEVLAGANGMEANIIKNAFPLPNGFA